jgi:hypothetical protein
MIEVPAGVRRLRDNRCTPVRAGEGAVPLWLRLLLTVASMLLASYLAGLLWHWAFNADIRSYLS